MNILYVSNTAPSETWFGGGQRTRLLYDALKKCGDVYCLYHYGEGESGDPKVRQIEWRERTDLLHYVNAITTRVGRLLLSKVPGWAMMYYPFPGRWPLERIFPGVRFDAVVVRYYALAWRCHLWQYAPLAIDIDDHPMQVYRTAVRPKLGFWRRMACDLAIGWACRRLEGRMLGGWVVSEDQRQWVRKGTRLAVLPNIPMMPPPEYRRARERTMRLVTVGVLGHRPNVAAVEGFLSEVWPKVRARWPEMEYWIVGRGAASDLVERWERIPGVKVCGFVEKLEDVYASAMAAVVGVKSGGGSCIKTLEALAYSCTCLTTEFGARGIDRTLLADGANGLRVWRDADEFVVQLERVAAGGPEIEAGERNGRRLIEERYSREAFEATVARSMHLVEGADNLV